MPREPNRGAAKAHRSAPTKGKRASAGRRSENGNESERQAELLAIAADRFAERGYVATTVRDIADVAGILSGSLYHHFDSKESMVDEILSTFLDEMLAAYREILDQDLGPRATLEGLVRASLMAMVNRRAAILIYQNESRYLVATERFSYLRDAAREFEKIWTSVLQRGIDEGEFLASIDPRLVYRLIRDTVWAAPRWFRPDGQLTPERIAEQYLSVLLDGIAAR
jgi:AcrR family transcriptional regulator